MIQAKSAKPATVLLARWTESPAPPHCLQLEIAGSVAAEKFLPPAKRNRLATRAGAIMTVRDGAGFGAFSTRRTLREIGLDCLGSWEG